MRKAASAALAAGLCGFDHARIPRDLCLGLRVETGVGVRGRFCRRDFGGGQELWDEISGQFGVKAFQAANSGHQMGGWFRKEINSLDDLVGLKMRIPGQGGDVLRALGAKKLDIMLKVGVPRSMPYFFGSLKIAITLAFVGSVVSETVASNSGLGNMMSSAQSQFNVPLVFAGLMMLAVEGIAMYALMAWIEKRMTGWAHRSTMSN